MNTFAKLTMASLLVLIGACDPKPGGGNTPAEAAAGSDAAAPPSGAAAPANAGPAASNDKPVDISSAKADPGTWMSFTAEEHKFEARFPVAPKKQDMSVPTPAGTIPAMMFMAEEGNDAVGVTVLTVPESMLGQFNVDGGLDGARDGMINNVGGTIVSEKQIDFLGHQARAIVAKASAGNINMNLEARLFWVSPRMYQLISVSMEGSPASPAEKFFSNFRLLE